MLHVNFNTYNNYVTDSLYQWDINQDLVITGLDLSVIPEVHFSNADMVRAIVKQASTESDVIKVRIPNSLLQKALTIKAYIGIYNGDSFNVIEIVEIPVIARIRPSDYSFEANDEEIYSFKAVENAMSNLIADHGKMVDDINASNNELRVDLLRKYNETQLIATNALEMVNGINEGYVFDTYEDLYANLSNVTNKNKYSLGNKLYIKDVSVSDYWIVEVLDSVDSATGLYYKILELETEKIDLSEYDYDVITDDELSIIYGELYG